MTPSRPSFRLVAAAWLLQCGSVPTSFSDGTMASWSLSLPDPVARIAKVAGWCVARRCGAVCHQYGNQGMLVMPLSSTCVSYEDEQWFLHWHRWHGSLVGRSAPPPGLLCCFPVACIAGCSTFLPPDGCHPSSAGGTNSSLPFCVNAIFGTSH
jgi:hypothetical protein